MQSLFCASPADPTLPSAWEGCQVGFPILRLPIWSSRVVLAYRITDVYRIEGAVQAEPPCLSWTLCPSQKEENPSHFRQFVSQLDFLNPQTDAYRDPRFDQIVLHLI